MLIFFRDGIWITPLGTQFPLADQSYVAFYLDLIIQMGIALIGILTTVSIEMAQVIVNNAVEMSADVIKLSVEEFNEHVESIGCMTTESRARYRNIILQIQDFDR